ncbi:MAG: hypothetical protein IPH75_08705 [bacterium]|nr:hypothetical protein [bacterium]
MNKSVFLIIVVVLTACQMAFAASTKPVEQNGWLEVSPSSIGYPEYTKPAVEKQYTLMLKNVGPLTITIPVVTPFEDSAKPSAAPGWLGYGTLPGDILPGDSTTMVLELNDGGVVMSSAPTQLFGRLRFYFGPSGDSLDLPISFIVADTIVFPVWDTVTTQCGIPLTVGTNGNLGAHGIGGANFGFWQTSPECDTGENNPGNADIYLADASPVIVRRAGVGNYIGSWSVHSGDVTSPNGFKPLFPSPNRGYFSGARWQGYNSGIFCTTDSLVKLERTVWAPNGATNNDSCKFVIMRTRIFPYSIGMSVSGLAIGDVFDWDIPSDSGELLNIAGTDPTRRLVYMRGFDSADPGTDCYNNSLRYGGAALIKMHMKDCVGNTTLFAGYNAANDSFVYPAGGFVPQQLWENMQSTGYSNESRIADLHSMLVYKNGAANAGFTLPANDTLNIWTAIAVVRPTGGTTAQGLDSLRKEIDKAFAWSNNVATCCCGCCELTRGNVISIPWTTPNLSDLSYLIAYMTVTPRPVIYCFAEADVNGSGDIDISDLSLLITFLTVTPRPTLPPCPF